MGWQALIQSLPLAFIRELCDRKEWTRPEVLDYLLPRPRIRVSPFTAYYLSERPFFSLKKRYAVVR